MRMMETCIGYTSGMADESTEKVAISFRMLKEEKAAYDKAARIAGMSLSTWMRTRLRSVVAKELRAAGEPHPFRAILGRDSGR
jgi:hypothetical protein